MRKSVYSLYAEQLNSIDQGQRCKALWLAVLDQALVDIRHPTGTPTQKGMLTRQLFVWSKTKDFDTICMYAGVDKSAMICALENAYKERRSEGKKHKRTHRNFL